MFRSRTDGATAPFREGASRAPLFFLFSLLAVEFLDELLCGVNEAAWPLMRDDLRLSYAEVGLLMSLPGLFANLVEPFIGILGDVWRRRALVVGGGVVFAASTLLVSVSQGFWLLLVAFMALNPAGGAFVGLSQATLMDAEPLRREQNMARWTLAGSLGNAAGPLAVAAAIGAGLGWRWLYA
ncbi:MAG TPA: MFS transporter, partial [Pyrinomonadaceae bacterium]|nr:MFS transporter [Pyrinomonadaceae bacterium]